MSRRGTGKATGNVLSNQEDQMQLLPTENIKLHVTDDGIVLVGAYEHKGSVWWTRLSNPCENLVGSRDLERVSVNVVDRSPIS
jgi:hypothetical protein